MIAVWEKERRKAEEALPLDPRMAWVRLQGFNLWAAVGQSHRFFVAFLIPRRILRTCPGLPLPRLTLGLSLPHLPASLGITGRFSRGDEPAASAGTRPHSPPRIWISSQPLTHHTALAAPLFYIVICGSHAPRPTTACLPWSRRVRAFSLAGFYSIGNNLYIPYSIIHAKNSYELAFSIL